MASRGVACLDCTVECERLHKIEGGFLPIVDRFFKILFGKDRSKFLYLPPESAKIVKHLTDQETQIEDSSGQRWAVTLSLVNGSLAFQKGWQKFYLDHGLKAGELLVFEYTGGSHFTVQIYGTSARERTNFNNELPCRRKKRRRCQGTASRDISISAISASSDELQNRNTKLAVENACFESSELLPIPVDVDVEDPICMIINQSIGYHEEHRSLFDLSFEMDNRTSDTNKCEGAAIIMLDPHTETVQSDVNLDDASGTKFSPSCNWVLEPTNPDGDEAMEQTKSTSKDAQIVENETDLITNGIGDISIDMFETALDSKTALSHTDIADEKGLLDSACGCKFQDGKEPSMILDHPRMNCPPVELTNPVGDDAAEQAKTTGDVSIDKLETALDAKTALSHTEITEQIIKNVDDTQMAPHSRQAGGHSGDAFMNRFYEKPSVNSKMKVMLDNICNVQDGKPEPVGISPSIGASKIAEMPHAAKSKIGEFSVSSSTVKNPLGLHAIKKEVKMEDTASLLHQVSSGGKEPPLMWNEPQMISPLVVKDEPDLPYETGQSDTVSPVSICSFSAEVGSKLYLEVPQIMSGVGRRLRAETLRAQTMRAQMIVYLRGSARKLWPVVYREYTGGKAFIGNWSGFCNENNIKPGDKCRFQPEEHVASFVFSVEVDCGSR